MIWIKHVQTTSSIISKLNWKNGRKSTIVFQLITKSWDEDTALVRPTISSSSSRNRWASCIFISNSLVFRYTGYHSRLTSKSLPCSKTLIPIFPWPSPSPIPDGRWMIIDSMSFPSMRYLKSIIFYSGRKVEVTFEAASDARRCFFFFDHIFAIRMFGVGWPLLHYVFCVKLQI